MTCLVVKGKKDRRPANLRNFFDKWAFEFSRDPKFCPFLSSFLPLPIPDQDELLPVVGRRLAPGCDRHPAPQDLEDQIVRRNFRYTWLILERLSWQLERASRFWPSGDRARVYSVFSQFGLTWLNLQLEPSSSLRQGLLSLLKRWQALRNSWIGSYR